VEAATAMAQKTVLSTLQGKLSVSVLAPSVKVSFGSDNDLVVVPDAPKALITQVLKKQVLPGFCKVFVSEQAGVGPNGQDINSWLSDIMDSMVSVIDEHVSAVLKATCPEEEDPLQELPSHQAPSQLNLPQKPSTPNSEKWQQAAQYGRAMSRQQSRTEHKEPSRRRGLV